MLHEGTGASCLWIRGLRQETGHVRQPIEKRRRNRSPSDFIVRIRRGGIAAEEKTAGREQSDQAETEKTPSTDGVPPAQKSGRGHFLDPLP